MLQSYEDVLLEPLAQELVNHLVDLIGMACGVLLPKAPGSPVVSHHGDGPRQGLRERGEGKREEGCQ